MESGNRDDRRSFMKASDRKSKDPVADRRNFLKLAGAVTGAAAAAVAGTAAQAATDARPQGEDGGYRETDHVKRYYDLARF
jgi:hypothetical protein